MFIVAVALGVMFTACESINFESELNTNEMKGVYSTQRFSVSLDMVKTFLSLSDGNSVLQII